MNGPSEEGEYEYSLHNQTDKEERGGGGVVKEREE